MLLYLGNCKQCYSQAGDAGTFADWCFSFGYTPRSGIAAPHSSSIFSFLRSLHTIFHSSCANLPSHQQCTRGLFPPHPHPRLPSMLFLMTAVLTGVRRRPAVVWISVFLVISDIHIFSFAACPSPFLFWENVYSALLPIFKSGLFFFF